MNKLHTKEPYQVPQVRVVEFRMEHGFAGSTGGNEHRTLSVPGFGNDNQQPKAASTFTGGYQEWN